MTKEELKRKRETLGLTQTKLAEILGVKNNTVARWESGVLIVPQIVEVAMLGIQIKMGKDVMAAAAELLPIAERNEAKAKAAKAKTGKPVKKADIESSDEVLYSTAEAALMLGLSERTVSDNYKPDKNGVIKLTSMKIGGNRFVKESDFNAFRDSRKG
jgi:DNA-binding XRE family transcriptional regulator